MNNSTLAKLLALALLATSASACSVVEGRKTAGEYVDDATITTKVKARIFEDKELKVLQINVQTFQGTVQLSGFVDKPYMKDRAEDIAASVHGVRAVNNDIVIRYKR